jgi:NAD(P)H-flavin reductase
MAKDEDENISLQLAKKIKVSDDTYIFRFGFPQEDAVLGLPIGKHVIFTANIANKEGKEEECCRKYTPIS